MTVSRAIEILDPTHREHYDNIEVVNEACRMGMEALKMQVPKKPVKDQWDHDCCPTCGYAGIYKDEWGGRYIPHCENCGQAIDWEDVVNDSR